ncbi:MAG: hypothetical protein WA792_18010 [Pseudolabrys sp.]|jgi:hypothetical protein
MPTVLPSKTLSDKDPDKKSDAGFLSDCAGVWAISLGVAAAGFAMFVYFGDGDQVAATFILCAAALLIQLATCASAQGDACDKA